MNREQRQSVENLLRTTVVGREIDLALWNEGDSKEARQEAAICERDIAAYRFALAILTDESEADRALGAKVRDIIVDRLTPNGVHPAEVMERIADHLRESTGSFGGTATLLRAIADALREEGGR